MKNLVYALAFLLLSACAPVFQSYLVSEPALYHLNDNTWAYRNPNGSPIVQVQAGGEVVIVGYHNDWLVAKSGPQYYYIRRQFLTPGASPSPTYYYASPPSRASVPVETDGVYHDTYTGPRGGQYYYNGNGNKQYITPQSTLDERSIQTGPRGGQYYINDNGRKTYIKH